jgi:general secretion pathway protein D
VATRNAKTSVQVGTGESVVLGGLIREVNSRTTSGLPLLSKIPILGAAFGTQTISRERTELVMIVTPRIVSDVAQAREATEELRKKLPSLVNILPKQPQTPPPATPETPSK